MAKKILQYQGGERIIQSGSREKRMYIILEGSVSISLSDGNNVIKVAEMHKGDFFGEISLFNNTPRSATVTAIDSVSVAYIDSLEELQAFLVRNPVFAAKMVNILAQRLAKTDEILIGKISEMNRIGLIRDV